MMEKKRRIVFIDQVRALAVTMMLVGHSLDRFLADAWKMTDAYRNYQFVRGLSSALFLTVAGFSLVISSFGRMADYTHLSERMRGRIRRISYILFLGMVLQIPSATLSGMLQVTDPIRWERFVSFNVLQNIGCGLALLHLILFLTRTTKRFAATVGICAIAIFALASITYRPEFDAALPFFLRGAFNLFHFSRFPLVPLTAFIFVGALFGVAYWQAKETPTEKWIFAAAAATGTLLIIFEQLIRGGMFGGLYPYATFDPFTPGNTFARLGCALLIICIFYLGNQFKVILAGPALTMSRESLAIYFIHLLIVYGNAHMKGIFSSMAHRMTLFQAGLFAVGLIAAMYGMAKGLGYMRNRHPTMLVDVRRSILIGGGLMFLFLSHLHTAGVIACLLAAFAFTYRRPLTHRLPSIGRTVKKVTEK